MCVCVCVLGYVTDYTQCGMTTCDHVTVMCSWYDHTLLRLPTLGMDQALFIVVNNYSYPVEYSSVSSACYKVHRAGGGALVHRGQGVGHWCTG